MKKFFKFIMWVVIIIFLAWVGTGVVKSCGSDTIKLPDVSKARYEVLITANRNVLYTNEYTQDGTVYVLHGFWHCINDKYRYSKLDLSLDTKTFGPIKINRRS